MTWVLKILKIYLEEQLLIKHCVNKILRKAFNIAKNPKYDGCQHGLASMVYNQL